MVIEVKTELKKRKIDEFFSWVNELTGDIDDLKHYIRVVYSEKESDNKGNYKYSEEVCFFTNNYKYVITAIDSSTNGGYLGCISSYRKSKPGKDRLRSTVLPSGPLNSKTWEEIKNAIIYSELIELDSKIPECYSQEDCSDIVEKEIEEPVQQTKSNVFNSARKDYLDRLDKLGKELKELKKKAEKLKT